MDFAVIPEYTVILKVFMSQRAFLFFVGTEMNYDPYYCGRRRCVGTCPVLGHELDKKRGNVFYDVKIFYLRTVFREKQFRKIVVPHFFPDLILAEPGAYLGDIHAHGMGEDIRNGIQIVHASDMEKRDSESKRERISRYKNRKILYDGIFCLSGNLHIKQRELYRLFFFLVLLFPTHLFR